MIEIIYKEEQKKAEGNEEFFEVPKNIRQIGEIKGHQKIYIEDYAYTFLKKISRNQEKSGKAAILFGKYHWLEGCSYLFIRSALEIQDQEVSAEHIVFSDKVWGQVYEDSRKYFPEQEIVGWFVSLPGFNMQMNEVLLKTHLNHFAGNDKALFVLEPGESEEAFFLYENNQLVRQPGYYIYYEKNDLMQSYMIEMSQNKSIEETEKVPDRAVVDFRKAVKEKREETEKESQETKTPWKNWVLGASAAAAILAVGVTFFQGYHKMAGNFQQLSSDAEQNIESQMASTDQVEATLIPSVIPESEGLLKEEEEAADKLETEQTEKMEEVQKTEKQEQLQETEKPEPAGEELEEKEKPEEGAAGPDGEASETEETAAGMQSGGILQEYVIQRGDTMTSICKNKYGSIQRLDEICRLNGIAPDDIIYAGQKLMLPE